MKIKQLIFISIFISLIIFLHSSEDNYVFGEWFTEDSLSKVHIYRDNESLTGKNVKKKNPVYPETDKEAGKCKYDRNNPDREKQKRPLIGLKIVWGFKFDGKNWDEGKIYDPESGKTYNCSIKKLDNNRLKIRGSLDKWGLLGRTTIWTKANE